MTLYKEGADSAALAPDLYVNDSSTEGSGEWTSPDASHRWHKITIPAAWSTGALLVNNDDYDASNTLQTSLRLYTGNPDGTGLAQVIEVTGGGWDGLKASAYVDAAPGTYFVESWGTDGAPVTTTQTTNFRYDIGQNADGSPSDQSVTAIDTLRPRWEADLAAEYQYQIDGTVGLSVGFEADVVVEPIPVGTFLQHPDPLRQVGFRVSWAAEVKVDLIPKPLPPDMQIRPIYRRSQTWTEA